MQITGEWNFEVMECKRELWALEEANRHMKVDLQQCNLALKQTDREREALKGEVKGLKNTIENMA